MSQLTVLGVLLGLAVFGHCQRYNGGDDGENSNLIYRPQQSQSSDAYHYQNTPPPPQILSHKQALNHDGQFKYLFTSENGLAQGESIAPDGSRNGGYSYTDPTGRKITVKYTAGKEGFRILEADHLPKAPQPVAPLPAPQQSSGAYTQSYGGQQDDGQYRPAAYSGTQASRSYYQAAAPQVSHAQPRAAYPTPVLASPTPQSNQLNEREPDYNDAPGKPYSFGNGYIFEFSG